jgi:hypothetical protein
MNAHPPGWPTIGLLLLLGGAASVFGILACVHVIGLVVSVVSGHNPLSFFGSAWILLGLLHLVTAAVSCYSFVHWLDGAPASLSAAAGVVLAGATWAVIEICWPHYVFFGM